MLSIAFMDRSLKKRTRHSTWRPNPVSPIDVGRSITITPLIARGHFPVNRLEIVIDPGPGFGLDHPTTLMALELIEDSAERRYSERSLLDVGSGTGVLAVAARALGFHRVLGVDIDPAAVFAARRNALLNSRLFQSTPGPKFAVGGIECVKGAYEVVAANLVAPVLLRLKDQLLNKASSELILSGIINESLEQVIDAFDKDLQLINRLRHDKWNALRLARRL
jgi:ribosomal protein L11 methyltransferase